MDASPATIQSSSRAARSRRWRSVLAGLISLALVLSFFHGWTSDGDDDAGSGISIAQSINDNGGKAPSHPAALHGDHCLTHVASMAPQETVFPIEYAPHTYGDVSLQLPASADRLSPFKPPRA
ncbi:MULTISPECIES: hypothetical protein [unclassified Bradyrhizobium]|uniref:hypothetical protein n=1 Tax=unclassified Bradyrhizobium TaxID=2631580 RepID=UPI0024798779|nr:MULTISPECIES: hypothetical protein [unclassified Bradyrhizobium]WGS23515.1 hypothetical protein MTX22_18975 [Bradyrhizobium sp. ISRA463]WGS30537.1 hypothetical protein MTX19_16700 [Bradyrhizobium sp. ISRA464]